MVGVSGSRKGRGAVIAAVAVAISMIAGCGGDDHAASTAAPAGERCAPARLRHEHELASDRRASLDAITVVHMEGAGTDALDARDTATAGVDEIPFLLESRATRRFGVGRGPVARATLRDRRGTVVVTLARGETSRSIDLAPGEYTLELVSDAPADGIVAVAPDACGSRNTRVADRSASTSSLAATESAATLGVPGVYVQEIAGVQTVSSIDTTVPAFVGPTTTGTIGPRLVTSLADYTAAFGAPSAASFVSLAVAEFFANGGTEAWVVATSTAGEVPTAPELVNGLAMLDPVTGFFTVAFPDLARLDPADAVTVAAAAVPFAARHLAFVVLDAPTSLDTPPAVTAWAADVTAALPAGEVTYASVYFPPLAAAVPGTSDTVTTGASGVLAGIYAATDTTVGPWQAPAGITHGLVAPGTPTILPVTETDAASLVAAGVNPIRTLPTYGEVVWGARTLAPTTDPTPFRYVETRRTLLMIEQSLQTSLQWTVFEPNDQTLWAAVTLQVSAFLTTLYAEGALVGDTASQAFTVVCDASNNPPETRALGTLYVDVAVALVEPAEFVTIRLTQQTSGPDA